MDTTQKPKVNETKPRGGEPRQLADILSDVIAELKAKEQAQRSGQ